MIDRHDEYRRKNRIKFFLAKFVFVLVCIGLVYLFHTGFRTFFYRDTVADNTFFCGIDVSGMDYTTLSGLINTTINDAVERSITLQNGNRKYFFSQSDYIDRAESSSDIILRIKNRPMYGRYETGIRFSLDLQKLSEKLDGIAKDVNVPAENAYVEDCGTYKKIVREQWGRRLNQAVMLKNIEKIMKYSNNKKNIVDLLIVDVQPEYTAKYYETLFRFEVTADEKKIDRNLIDPRERMEFETVLNNFNNIIITGFFNYREMGLLQPGAGKNVTEFLPGVFYEMCLRCGMNIAERSHKAIVSDITSAPGMDVVADSPFRMENTQGVEILVKTGIFPDGYQIQFLCSKKLYDWCRIESRTIEVIPYPTKRIRNYDLAPGETRIMQKGVDGLKVKMQRVFSKNGETFSEPISEDMYEPVEQIILFH